MSPGSKLPVPGGPDVITKDPPGGSWGPWVRERTGEEAVGDGEDTSSGRGWATEHGASRSWERRKRTLPSASGRSQVTGAFQTDLWVVGLSSG